MLKRVVIGILFLLQIVHANTVLTNQTSKNDHFTIRYYYDDSSKLTINDVSHIDFNESIPSQFNKGYRYGAGWFKIDVENKSRSKDFILYFTEPIWSSLDLYIPQGSAWSIQHNGLNVPLSDRAIQDSSPAFSFSLDPGEKISLYIRGKTIASQIGEFQIFTAQEFYRPDRMSITEWYIIYAFLLLSFALLNLYNLMMTKEPIYGYYVLYILVYIVFSFMHSGVYLRMGFPGWNEGLHTLGQLTLVSLLLFSKEFLELEKTYPKMERIFLILAGIALVFAFLLAEDLPFSSVASNLYFSSVLLMIIYVAITVLNRGFENAKYYLLALMFYLPSMTMMALDFNTLLPNTDLTRYSFLLGAYLEMFLFTLLLTNRYKHVNNLNHLLIHRTNQLEEMKKLFLEQSITDFLTGLYNRRHFVEISQKYFQIALRQHQPLSIMMIDIDSFKAINDTYGHVFGDRVIASVADSIRENTRDSDLTARYGGEEFIVLLPATDVDEAYDVAERVRHEVESIPVEYENGTLIHITVSIGLSHLHPSKDDEIDKIILRADQALYEAKNAGRNRTKRIP